MAWVIIRSVRQRRVDFAATQCSETEMGDCQFNRMVRVHRKFSDYAAVEFDEFDQVGIEAELQFSWG